MILVQHENTEVFICEIVSTYLGELRLPSFAAVPKGL